MSTDLTNILIADGEAALYAREDTLEAGYLTDILPDMPTETFLRMMLRESIAQELNTANTRSGITEQVIDVLMEMYSEKVIIALKERFPDKFEA